MKWSMVARSYTWDSPLNRFHNRSSDSLPRSSSRSPTPEQSLLRSSFTSFRGTLNRNDPEEEEPRPTVYLRIMRPELRNDGISWTIAISVPGDLDYTFDILPNNKPLEGFHVREERMFGATKKSEIFKATIKLGSVPAAEHSLDHVVNGFRSQPITTDKPNGMSVIWVTDVLGQLNRTGYLEFEKGANEKIEEQICAMERRLKASSSTGRP